MADYELCMKEEENLLTIKVVGNVEVEELLKFAAKTFSAHKQVLVLWDITQGCVSRLSKQDIIEIAQKMKNLRPAPKGAKTALVVKSISDFGIMRMYEVHADFNQNSIAYEVYYDLDDACSWLRSTDPAQSQNTIETESELHKIGY